MKDNTQKVVILKNFTSPYVSQAIIVLKDYNPKFESKAVLEAENIVSSYINKISNNNSVEIKKKSKKGKIIAGISIAAAILTLLLIFR